MASSNDSSCACIRKNTNGGALLRSLVTDHEALEAPPLDKYGLEEFGTAFGKPGSSISKDIERLWPAVSDELGDDQVLTAPQYPSRPPTTRTQLVPEIDGIYAAEAPLRRLLALASVVGLPRQIEREEANMVRRSQMPSFITEGHHGSEPVFGSDPEDEEQRLQNVVWTGFQF